MRIRFIGWYGPPILWCALIFFLSHQPQLPSTPGGDKTAHVVTYAILAALSARALWFGTRWRNAILFPAAAIFAALYGASDELHQSFVPGRHAGFDDFIADAAGALLGGLAFYLLGRFTTWVRRDTGGAWSDGRSPSS